VLQTDRQTRRERRQTQTVAPDTLCWAPLGAPPGGRPVYTDPSAVAHERTERENASSNIGRAGLHARLPDTTGGVRTGHGAELDLALLVDGPRDLALLVQYKERTAQGLLLGLRRTSTRLRKRTTQTERRTRTHGSGRRWSSRCPDWCTGLARHPKPLEWLPLRSNKKAPTET
jgi:hypothetical protein